MNETLGLIAAMGQESKALLHFAHGLQRLRIERLPLFKFMLANQPCGLVTSGMGARRANAAARQIIEKLAPSAIISFGIGGAVEADLDIGEVVLAQANCQWDGANATALTPLASWPPEAIEAAAHALAAKGKRVLTGTVITAISSHVGQDQLGDLPHPVLELETAGIAQVAKECGIPLFSLRAISDGPRAPIPSDLGEMMDADANLKMGNMIGIVLRNPKILLQARRIINNTQIAADNAALALVAALGKMHG